jgi:HlyD family secretion protein
MRKLFVIVVVLLAVGGGAVWGYWKFTAPPANHFRTAAVERGRLEATIGATGTLQPEEVIDVGAQVAGRIESFGKDPTDPKKVITWGSEVSKDTILAQIDDSLYKADMEAAKAEWERAKADLELKQAQYDQAAADWKRAEDLKSQNGISPAEYDAAKAANKMTKANLSVSSAQIAQTGAAYTKAQTNLNYTTIRSPVQGVIIDRRINVGQTVVASLSAPSLFLIAKDLTKMEVWAVVNEADIGRIHIDQPVRFTVDALSGRTFKGKVVPQGNFQARLNVNMVNNVVTYTVVVGVDNSDRALLPYQTANLNFIISDKSDALLVPNAALRWQPARRQIHPEAQKAYDKLLRDKRGDSSGQERGIVWIADDGYVRPVPLRLGLSDGVNTEVLAGELPEGAEVVIGESSSRNTENGGNPFAPKMFGGGAKKE